MSLQTIQAKMDLKELVDMYAILTDEKRISDQMLLFTPDAKFKVYMGEQLVSDVTGTVQLEQDFNGHVGFVKRYFSMNGQHVVSVEGDNATGILFSQMKMLRDEEGREVITDYSVQYNDVYVRQNEKWLIKERTSKYIFIQAKG
ncbi:nuclear transport factor 2 family protein [Paenibacillus sp. FSL R7-0331]|uniref:nuclear transport factor 2 family protein n=1 Tax=Paenibacillus sp. FSL R7-0331 TaxID=1536773 RepID=UPI0004F74540|nr:nuclear transport factor 2 family protein [Paenibacillus sp. FSL R7-0331]AIQ52930.1 hypothetical protein R70331_16300 [Paenibacillus sp. FSL R7-0331]